MGPLTCSKRTRSHSWALDWLEKSLLPLLTVWVVVSSGCFDCDCCSTFPSSCHGSILCSQQRDGKRKTIRLGCHGQPTLQAPAQTCASQIWCHLLIATTLYSSSLFVEWVPFDSCYSMYSRRSQAAYLLACFSFEVIISFPNRSDYYSYTYSFLPRYLKGSYYIIRLMLRPHCGRSTTSSLRIPGLLNLILSCTLFTQLAFFLCRITPRHLLLQ